MEKRNNGLDLKIGVDIVYIPRIEEVLNSDEKDRFLKRCFSREEISESKRRRRSAEYLSGRFAIKEALVKLNGSREGICFSEITTYNKRGLPLLKFKGNTKRVLGRYDIKFSVSHDGSYAIAVAIGREQ